MGYPVLKQAESVYSAIFNERFNQKLVMSAVLLLGNKSYRLVGTVKKTWYGKVQDYNTLNCMIVDENLEVLKDEQLSKRIYFAFSTLSMIYMAKGHIENSRLEDPAYFYALIDSYEEIIRRVKPVLRVFKKPTEYYDEIFNSFYQFLVLAHLTNKEGDLLARKLFPLLKEIEEHQPMFVEEIETVKEIANQFFTISNQRTLLVMKYEEMFNVMNWIIDRATIDKDIDLKEFSVEVTLIYQIIKGSKGAIKSTRVSSQLQDNLKTTEEIIAQLQTFINRGTYVEDISTKYFHKHWAYRKEVRK
ncbi:hypothetical protein [Halalkalibacter alkalisediminis]|uniref:Uncharacterized protein n=1 Tax=Halalkalibacter alkalisediminis TaxID=935616 RepID=A0ABV6NKJ2_9BACI|nr:hypothetical protein [Halalkalibacter alkalisediminis]